MLHRYGDVLLAFNSSNVSEAPGRGEFDIPAENPGFAATELRVSSRMRLSRMTTLAISLVKRRMGVLPTALQVECEDVLSRVICGQS